MPGAGEGGRKRTRKTVACPSSRPKTLQAAVGHSVGFRPVWRRAAGGGGGGGGDWTLKKAVWAMKQNAIIKIHLDA